MQQTADRLVSTPLASGDGFYEALARAMLERCPRELAAADLSAVRVLVPALPMAVELRSALLRESMRPLLLPRFDTLPQWVQSAPLPGIPDVLPESERLVLLHGVQQAKQALCEVFKRLPHAGFELAIA